MLKDHSKILQSLGAQYDVRGIFIDGDEVSVIYEMKTNYVVSPVSYLERIVIHEGKIISSELKFDRYHMQQLIMATRKQKVSARLTRLRLHLVDTLSRSGTTHYCTADLMGN